MRCARSLLVFVLLSCPPLAHAQSAAESIEQGVALREEGRDEEALALFQRAYQDDGSGEALAQVALAEQALGRLVEAEAHLASALAETADPFVRRHRAALQSALDEVRGSLGDIEIQGGTPGAEVWIDDASRGVLPLAGPIRVPLGAVRVELRAAGRVISESTVVVSAGEVAILTAILEPTPVRVPIPVPVARQREPEPVVPASPAGESVWLPVGIGVAALGVVLAGVATGLMVLREDSARARLSCVDTDPACRAHFQTALDAEGAGVALYVTSVALAATGAVLVLVDVLGHDAGESSAFACAPGALSVFCRGRF